VITSPHNEKLKRIRKLRGRRERDRTGLFLAEGEDLVGAAEAAGAEPDLVLVAGEDVDPKLLAEVSTLGSGTRVIGVYRQRWSRPGGELSVYLHGVSDPGNIGTIIRAADALCDGPVVLGPGCADPYSPKAVRASMGSVLTRPPARAELAELTGAKLALDGRAEAPLEEVEVEPPVVVCLGAERAGLPAELVGLAAATARIPIRAGGPESLNVAIAAAVALYELRRRFPPRPGAQRSAV
jgi:TrmH family RNA methyltransferase